MEKSKKGLVRLFVGLLVAMMMFLPAMTAEAKTTPKLNKTAVTVYVKGTTTLKLSGAKVKSWKSSNTKVAKVTSKGVVTGVAAGKATITCTDTKGKRYKCTVTVKKPYLNVTSKKLNIGQSFTLKLYGTNLSGLSISNSSAVSYKTDWNKNTITVKAMKAGTVEFKLTGVNKKSYTCKIIISDPKAKKDTKPSDSDDEHAHTHSFVEYYKYPAGCTYDGFAYYYCNSCGEYKSETLHAYGAHDFRTKEIPATCQYGSHTENECSRCGYYTTSEYKDDQKECDFQLVSETPSTCTEYGNKRYECSGCGSYKTKSIAPEHKNTYSEITKKTKCTEYTYTNTYCRDCGQKVSSVINADSYQNHQYNDKQLVKSDAFVRTSVYIYPNSLTNSKCYGYVLSYYEQKCKNCGDVVSSTSKSYKSHKLSSMQKSATGATTWYAHDGVANKNYCGEHTDTYAITCSECGASKATHVEYVAHTFDTVSGTIDVAPTLTTKGVADMRCQTCTFTKTDISYWVTRYWIVQREKQIINSIIKNGMTDEQKYRAIYDWLAKNVTYDRVTCNYIENKTGTPSIDHGQSSASALFFGTAVCAGYATTFDELCEIAGLPCKYVRSTKMCHAWNLIKINGTWYWADATWASTTTGGSASTPNCYFKQAWSESNKRSSDEVISENPTYYHYGY